MHLARGRLSFDVARLAPPRRRSPAAVGERAAVRPRRRVDHAAATGTRTSGPAARSPRRPRSTGRRREHPVALVRIDGHATWANSAALAAAGIDRHTPDPAGGLIVRDGRGEPTGLLIDTAQSLLQAIVPRPSDEHFDRAVRECIADCLAVGLTGIHEMGAELYALACLPAADRARPSSRSATTSPWPRRSDSTWSYYRERGPGDLRRGRAPERRRREAHGRRRARLARRRAARRLLRRSRQHRAGAGAGRRDRGRHARGGGARLPGVRARHRRPGQSPRAGRLRAGARAARRSRDHRLRVEHAQILADDDIPRFRRLGVLPSMQATHCTSDMAWAGERLGPERLRGAYAWRSLLATGVVIAGGSDFPVESPNPFYGTSRLRHAPAPDAATIPRWQPEQRMTRDEAVRSFTIWNAYASRQEADLGTLEPGKRADLVVLSEDVFTCPEERIAEIRPVLTLVGGDIVYTAARAGGRRPRPPRAARRPPWARRYARPGTSRRAAVRRPARSRRAPSPPPRPRT